MSEVESFCPVCGGEMEDSRHVSVECFYDVQEVVPTAEMQTIFREVPAEGTFWGTTRRYSGGTKDRHVISTVDEKTTKVDIEQDPVPAIRLLEQHVYSVTCCKSCRADFLNMFAKWSKGRLRARQDDNDERNIPVRVRGATVMMTLAEFDAHRRKREAS
jgi:hypothetical protein